MRDRLCFLVALFALCLIAGCNRTGTTATSLPPEWPQGTRTGEPGATSRPGATDSEPVCPPPDGGGTVSPAVSIYSILFMVNGVEQVVRDGDILHALPGDQVQVREAIICTGSFSGNGGEACVDVVPLDASGREVTSEHGGTHLLRVTPGFISTSGPDQSWIIDEDWTHLSAVLNHWPPETTADSACAEGRCERDDWMAIRLRDG